MMRNAVSIALFGKGNDYAQYLPTFVRAHLNLFPISQGWDLILNLGNDVDFKWAQFANDLERKGLIEVRRKQADELTRAMLWRMSPVFEQRFDHVFCRDLDALPTPRDRVVCEQFIKSGLAVHTVHDNLYHMGIMGGLCGFNCKKFKEETTYTSLDEIYAAAKNVAWSKKGTDQDVLNSILLSNPHVTLLEHRFAGWTNGTPSKRIRSAGTYACQAWSTPVPDVGVSDMTAHLSVEADRLAPHMGSAGYNITAAKEFYITHGDKDVSEAVEESLCIVR